MEDSDFYDHVYQIWSKTTGADDRFWMPKQLAEPGSNRIVAVADDHSEKLVASLVSDEDADFITSIHGCFADLIRRLKEYEDRTEALDVANDELIGRIAQLEQAADAAEGIQIRLEEKLDEKDQELSEANGYVDHLNIQIADLERELDARP